MKKPIPDFPDYYVHADGYVISHKSGKEKILAGCLRGGSTKTGKYKGVNLLKNGKQFAFLVHILVAKAFIENPQNLPQVNHKDGNKFNNNVNNLEWSTPSDNQKHAVKTGLWKSPTAEHYELMKVNAGKSMARFTLEEGSEIMEMKAALGLSCEKTSEIIGCSSNLIKRLSRGAIKYFKNGAVMPNRNVAPKANI
jgi:hypothetical protein